MKSMARRRLRVIRLSAAGFIAALIAGCVPAPHADAPPPRPLAIHGVTSTIELAPVLLAARDHSPLGTLVHAGGIPNLFADHDPADLATNAETQALRASVAHPDLRIILTVAEGRYRIVARRSAGIATLADLKGKRIATLTHTSSGYFLHRMLATVGLSLADVEICEIAPLPEMAEAIARGDVDAVAIWEPHSLNAEQAIGADAIIFEGTGVYRELFNLNARAADLADPARRRRIVAMVRAIIDTSRAMRLSPGAAQTLVAQTAGYTPAEVARAWPHIGFVADYAADMLDLLETEERWLAALDGRAPRSRDTLSHLIDRSVYEEALALAPRLSR